MNHLREFFEFIRFKLCIFAAVMGASGYLLSGTRSHDIFYVMLIAFLLCTGTYSYNNIFDIAEDAANKRYVSRIARSEAARAIPFFCFIAGAIFSLLFKFAVTFLSLFIIFLGVMYSKLRIKRYLFAKNLYTGFGIGLLFLLGAFSGGYSHVEIYLYYVFFSLVVLIGSLISDLRDFVGDTNAGIRTIPVVFGTYATTRIIYILLAGIAFIGVIAIQSIFAVALVIITCLFLARKKYGYAHACTVFFVVFLSLYVAIS